MLTEEIAQHYPKHLEDHEQLKDKVEHHEWQISHHNEKLTDLDRWKEWALKIILGAMLVGIMALLGIKK